MKLKPYTTAPFLAVLVYLLTICAGDVLAQLDATASGYLYAFGGIQLAAYIIPLVLYALLFGGVSFRNMRFALPTAVSTPLQLLLLFILLLGTSLISLLLKRLGIVSFDVGGYTGGTPGILALAVAAVIPAVCEEVLFRGVIMTSFEPCGISPAVIGSSLLFAFAHMSLEELVLYFFSGVVLAFSVYVSRSLLTAIVLHAIYNISTICFGNYLSGIAAHLESFSLLFILLLFGLWALVLIALTEGSRIYRIYAERALDSSYVPKRMSPAEKIKGNASVFLSVPFLLAALVYIAIVIFSMQDIA